MLSGHYRWRSDRKQRPSTSSNSSIDSLRFGLDCEVVQRILHTSYYFFTPKTKRKTAAGTSDFTSERRKSNQMRVFSQRFGKLHRLVTDGAFLFCWPLCMAPPLSHAAIGHRFLTGVPILACSPLNPRPLSPSGCVAVYRTLGSLSASLSFFSFSALRPVSQQRFETTSNIEIFYRMVRHRQSPAANNVQWMQKFPIYSLN